MRFLEMRNMLMEQHNWNRRVATLATRLYRGVDTPADFVAAASTEWGRILLTVEEYRTICQTLPMLVVVRR